MKEDCNQPSTCLTKKLVQAVIKNFHMNPYRSIHGVSHWMRVRYNGLLLAPYSGADPQIIELFALFHDSCRQNDGRDPEHGRRGGLLAKEFFDRGQLDCNAEQLEIIIEACNNHTSGYNHSDPNIGTCWDSDRLDLPRVGIDINPKFLSTDFAKTEEVIVEASIRADTRENHLNDIPGLFD